MDLFVEIVETESTDEDLDRGFEAEAGLRDRLCSFSAALFASASASTLSATPSLFKRSFFFSLASVGASFGFLKSWLRDGREA